MLAIEGWLVEFLGFNFRGGPARIAPLGGQMVVVGGAGVWQGCGRGKGEAMVRGDQRTSGSGCSTAAGRPALERRSGREHKITHYKEEAFRRTSRRRVISSAFTPKMNRFSKPAGVGFGDGDRSDNQR